MLIRVFRIEICIKVSLLVINFNFVYFLEIVNVFDIGNVNLIIVIYY